MRKIFFATLLVLMMSIQICGAATIDSAKFNGNDKLVYPVVSLSNRDVAQKINVAIVAEVDRFLTGVYRNAQTNNYTVADVRTSFEVGSNESGGTVILSLVLTESCYYAGAAHPATVKTALNFNVGTGDLMGIDYLTDIGEGVSVDELRGRVEWSLINHSKRENLYLFEEAVPLKNLPENFYWDANLHVHFIFQHYEVAPYAMGIIDVDIDA